MPDQPDKPGATSGGDPTPIDDQPAVENQSTVTPEDYPEPAKGAAPATT